MGIIIVVYGYLAHIIPPMYYEQHIHLSFFFNFRASLNIWGVAMRTHLSSVQMKLMSPQFFLLSYNGGIYTEGIMLPENF